MLYGYKSRVDCSEYPSFPLDCRDRQVLFDFVLRTAIFTWGGERVGEIGEKLLPNRPLHAR